MSRRGAVSDRLRLTLLLFTYRNSRLAGSKISEVALDERCVSPFV